MLQLLHKVQYKSILASSFNLFYISLITVEVIVNFVVQSINFLKIRSAKNELMTILGHNLMIREELTLSKIIHYL